MSENQKKVNYNYAGVIAYRKSDKTVISKVLCNDIDLCCEEIANAYTVFAIHKSTCNDVELLDVHITNLKTKEVISYSEKELNEL